ncbi:MAG: hypothetical protein ACPGJV_10645 [Bacteriovoracaceae bacterium]
MNLIVTFSITLLFSCSLSLNVFGKEDKPNKEIKKSPTNKYLYFNSGAIGIKEDYFASVTETSAITYAGVGFNHVFHQSKKNLLSYGFSITYSGDSEGFSTGMSYYSRVFWHRVMGGRWASKLGAFYRQLPLVSIGSGVKKSSSFDLFGPEFGLTYFVVMKGKFFPISLSVAHGVISTREYEVGGNVEDLKGVSLKLSTQVKLRKEWSINFALENVMLTAGDDISVKGTVVNLGFGHHF